MTWYKIEITLMGIIFKNYAIVSYNVILDHLV